jgi:CheY-like chemotaxis protein
MLKQVSAGKVKHVLGNHPYVLLVEDEPIAQKVHTTMLQRLGCKVDLAINGTQALAMCANHYDIILLDCGLPDIDGFELDKELRKQEQALGIKSRPHIMLTAFNFETFADDLKACTINDYAIKPIAYNNLQALMQKWLGKKFLVS